MTTWILMIALWSGNVKEFHYFGTYTSSTQCNETAERVKRMTMAPEAPLRWLCMEVPK